MGLFDCCGLFGDKKSRIAPDPNDAKATQGASPTQTSATQPSASPRPLNYAIPQRANGPSDPAIAAAVQRSVKNKRQQSRILRDMKAADAAENADNTNAGPAISPSNIAFSPNSATP